MDNDKVDVTVPGVTDPDPAEPEETPDETPAEPTPEPEPEPTPDPEPTPEPDTPAEPTEPEPAPDPDNDKDLTPEDGPKWISDVKPSDSINIDAVDGISNDNVTVWAGNNTVTIKID